MLVTNSCLGYYFMMKPFLAKDLRNFEKRIAYLINKGIIQFPIHLSDGNEDSLIKLFSDIKKSDWVFSTWRSHYHCLLKGVTENELENAILNGHSISLNFPSHRMYSSAIVGGQISQAVGVAISIKIQNEITRVINSVFKIITLSKLQLEQDIALIESLQHQAFTSGFKP
jgi:pyruvate dehydrogenase E1 component alpha subunit